MWIERNWRTPYKDDPNLVFLMCVARLVNWPDTLQWLTQVLIKRGRVAWDSEKFVDVLHHRARNGEKVFSGAYIVSTNGRAMDKAEYLAQFVLTPLWERRATLQVYEDDNCLETMFNALTAFDGMGSFLAAQVVADVKYTKPWVDAEDWWTFAASGPGSRRGLNRVLNSDVDKHWVERQWRFFFHELQKEIDQLVAKAGMPRLHAQDLQNCLCEFDKYERVRLGEGKPRSKYLGV
jgi:hypothetical protein